jgi:hypothetical protein
VTADAAFASVGAFLWERDSRAGIIARECTGQERPQDRKLAQILSNERRARTRMDGSVDGSLVKTAWAAWEMMDLGEAPTHGGLDRLVSWTLLQLESPRAAGDRAPLTLPTGLLVQDDAGASFAARCLALRVLLRARRESRPGIERLLDQLATGPQPPTLDLSASALGTLALIPPPHRRHLDGLIGRIGRAQQDDGTWAEGDLFHMLEALVLAGVRGARTLIARSAPALARLVREDGTFDDPPHTTVHEERALIALRSLQIAIEDEREA